MASIDWQLQINFASALLLHSCITVVLKEASNAIEILRRIFLRWRYVYWLKDAQSLERCIKTSAVLDAYTSIFCLDLDGEQSELYFTNTGLGLLALSLASSVAMNVFLSDQFLNIIVAATFGSAFFASLAKGRREAVLPIMALRRAGRFIWSDTPFVNFFSLIYIATVLRGKSELRLQDYVVFRSIAVLELIFMKAKLAASSVEEQEVLMRKLIQSEWVAIRAMWNPGSQHPVFPRVNRHAIVAFTTQQRLSVMLFKTTVGFDRGCLQGLSGPAIMPMPRIGTYIAEPDLGWKVYRLSEDVMILADCFAETNPRTTWGRFIAQAHGVLLRRLGKTRVVYLLYTRRSGEKDYKWLSNANLVTGVSQDWLDMKFFVAQNQDNSVISD